MSALSRSGHRRQIIVQQHVIFANDLDAARYRTLVDHQQELQHQLRKVDRELCTILRRADWPVNTILEREG